MKTTGSLIIAGAATFALALANVANAEEVVHLSSAEMDSVTAGSEGGYGNNGHNGYSCPSIGGMDFDDAAQDSTLIAIATATAIGAPNTAIGGNVTNLGDTTAIARITVTIGNL